MRGRRRVPWHRAGALALQPDPRGREDCTAALQPQRRAPRRTAELLGQLRDLALDRASDRRIVGTLEHAGDPAGDRVHLCDPEAASRERRRAEPDAARHPRLLRDRSGTAFLLTVMRARWSASSATLPVRPRRRRSTQHEVVVGAARDQVEAALDQRRRRARARSRPRAAGRRGSRRVSASPKHTALAAMTCISGPPWSAGNTALSSFSAQRRAAQHEPAARAAQRLVRGAGHQVGVRHRARVEPGRDQPGDVRHVDHERRPDLARDRGRSARSR